MTDYNMNTTTTTWKIWRLTPVKSWTIASLKNLLAYAGRKKLPSGAPSTSRPGSCTTSLSLVLTSGKTLTSMSYITVATKTRSTKPSLLAVKKRKAACFCKG